MVISNTCTYSYATQGIWGPWDDKLEVHAAERSHAKDIIVSGESQSYFDRLKTLEDFADFEVEYLENDN